MKKLLFSLSVILLFFCIPANNVNAKILSHHISLKKKLVVDYYGTYGVYEIIVSVNSAHRVIGVSVSSGSTPYTVTSFGASGTATYNASTANMDLVSYQIDFSDGVNNYSLLVSDSFYPIN